MKIAVIQRFLPDKSRGGVGHFAHGLANELRRRGHQVVIFTQDPAPADALYETKVLSCNYPGWMKPLVFPFQLARQSFEGFDLIHAQGDEQWIRRAGIPLVRTLHGSALAEAVHNGLRQGSVKNFLMHLYFYFFEFIAVLKADALTAVSSQTFRYYPGGTALRRMIPNGINLEKFSAAGGEKSKSPSIFFVGEMKSRKRGDLLLKIFRDEILPAFPEAELWLAAPEKREGPGVRWFGEVTERQLIDLYRRAWIFCMPSSYEGFGRPYAEAMACGTAVLAAPNPGSREILEEGKYGVVIGEKEIGPGLIELLTDTELRRRFEEEGPVRAKEYSWSRVAEDYEKIYEAVLAKAHKK